MCIPVRFFMLRIGLFISVFVHAVALQALEFSTPQTLHAPGTNSRPQLGYTGETNWFCVWTGRAVNESTSEVYISRSSDEGASWSPPAHLLTQAAADARSDATPVVLEVEPGVWLLVHLAAGSVSGPLGSDTDLLLARSTDSGQSWSYGGVVNSNAATDAAPENNPQIATDGAEHVVCVWESRSINPSSPYNQVAFARSADRGLTWSEVAFLDSRSVAGGAVNNTPQIACHDGRWIAVWASTETLGGTTGIDFDIVYATSTDDGVSWTTPSALTERAKIDSGYDLKPRITCDSEGRWIVIWYSDDTMDGTTGADSDILYSWSADGIGWSDARPLNRNARNDGGSDWEPRLASDGHGGTIAMWCSNNLLPVGSSPKINLHFSRSVNGGVSWSKPEYLNSDAPNDARQEDFSNLVSNKHGGWVAAWSLTGISSPYPIMYATLNAIDIRTAVGPAVWKYWE
jgi:hypothetical protein